MDQCGSGRFAVGAGDADHLVWRKACARGCEQFDIADDRQAILPHMRPDGVRIEGHPGRDNHARKAGKIKLQRVDQAAAPLKHFARVGLTVPGDHFRSARQQGFGRRRARTGEAEHGIALALENGRGDHAARPSST